jgi:hypothetical protein
MKFVIVINDGYDLTIPAEASNEESLWQLIVNTVKSAISNGETSILFGGHHYSLYRFNYETNIEIFTLDEWYLKGVREWRRWKNKEIIAK